MNLIQGVIRQPVTVTVGVILTLMAGIIALYRIPVQLTPNVESTIITVSTTWEGASPGEIEQNVIDKQEERLLGLSNLSLMTSTSSQGAGQIRLEFLTGTDKNVALREVSDKLREVPDYPEIVDEPVVEATDPESRDFIAWIVFGTTDPDFDVRMLRDFAVDRIEPALERVSGISEINVLGGREREVQIQVDPVLLAQHGITPTRFAEVIRDTNQNMPAGQLADGKLDVRLRTIGQYRSIEEIERTVLADTAAGKVLLRDVAEAVLTYKEPTSFVRSKGRQVIAINADREPGTNVMEVMDGLKSAIADLNQPGGVLDAEARRLGLNGTLTLTQVYDQTVYIDDALGLVEGNIWVGGALATLVLLLFLRSVRSVAIIALAIPISTIGAIVIMVAMGRTVNAISLAGMAFAVGMVVDNAIVVLENIFRHLEMGKSRWQAAFDGTREVWLAILASTATTLVAFIPILLVKEEAGQLFRDISLAICAAVGLSLLVSVTVIPCAAARILKAPKRREVADADRLIPGGFTGLVGSFIYRVCGSTGARLTIVAALTGASILGTYLLMPPADYLPTGNRNLVFGLIISPPGYNIEQLDAMADRIEETVRPFWEAGELKGDPAAYQRAVENLPSFPTFDHATGTMGDPVVPPTLENYFLVAFDGILFHGGIADDAERVVDLLPLFAHATRAEVLPGTFAFPFQVPLFQTGGSTGSAVKLQLAGPDLGEVTRCARAVFKELLRNNRFQQPPQPAPGNFMLEAPELQVRPDLVRLSELGLSTRDVGLLVAASGDGAIIDEYQLGGETIDLKIISSQAVDQKWIGDLRDLPIATPGGETVTVGSLAEIRRTGEPEQIARVNRQRSVSFQVTPVEGVALERAMEEMDAIIAAQRQAGVIPSTVTSSLAGSACKLGEVRGALLGDGTLVGTLNSSMVLALVVVYLVMCVLFQGWLQPLVIMFTVPLATLGGFAALAAVHRWSVIDRYMPVQQMDVLTMLGFVILIGVVVNNAILIVHQALNFMQEGAEVGGPLRLRGPLPPRRAIAEAVRTRIRPIFMSTLTSVLGMMPLVLMPGPGSELYRGLGAVVLGGLMVSTIFTILLTPMLMSLILDLLPRKPRTHPAGAPASAPPPAPSFPRRPALEQEPAKALRATSVRRQ